MKRFVLFLISSCVGLIAAAQEEIVLDSLKIRQPDQELNSPEIDRPVLNEKSFQLNRLNFSDQTLFNQPLLPDYSRNFDFSKPNKSTFLPPESFSVTKFGPSPYYINGTVFNQATYRLNDRFSFGGNSFGAQSVFDLPQMNPSMQNMSTKGASMFFQYKVSKNVKVETRVNISNHQSPWEP
jgi:hypothetical protein